MSSLDQDSQRRLNEYKIRTVTGEQKMTIQDLRMVKLEEHLGGDYRWQRASEDVREVFAGSLHELLNSREETCAAWNWFYKGHTAIVYSDSHNMRKVQVIEMLLWCPECGERHIDSGEFAQKPHHTHACQYCGMVWRPAVVDTVGVGFLSGFLNEKPKRAKSKEQRIRIMATGGSSSVISNENARIVRGYVGDNNADLTITMHDMDTMLNMARNEAEGLARVRSATSTEQAPVYNPMP